MEAPTEERDFLKSRRLWSAVPFIGNNPRFVGGFTDSDAHLRDGETSGTKQEHGVPAGFNVGDLLRRLRNLHRHSRRALNTIKSRFWCLGILSINKYFLSYITKHQRRLSVILVKHVLVFTQESEKTTGGEGCLAGIQ